jgi:hypothetical protein
VFRNFGCLETAQRRGVLLVPDPSDSFAAAMK